MGARAQSERTNPCRCGDRSSQWRNGSMRSFCGARSRGRRQKPTAWSPTFQQAAAVCSARCHFGIFSRFLGFCHLAASSRTDHKSVCHVAFADGCGAGRKHGGKGMALSAAERQQGRILSHIQSRGIIPAARDTLWDAHTDYTHKATGTHALPFKTGQVIDC